MVMKRGLGDYIFDSLNYILMFLFSLTCLYPVLYVIFASFSEPSQIVRSTGVLLRPLGFTLAGYNVVLNNPNIQSGYLNTIIYASVGTTVNMLMTVFGAYVLSRRYLYLRKIIMVFIIITMYFGGGLIPNFLLVRALGLINTRAALILPQAIGTWNMIVMRTAFRSIPASLEESARIDGANDFTILFRIIIPVVPATMAVITLFYVVGHWNSWLPAVIYLRSRSLFPLQLILREILIAHGAGGNLAAEAVEAGSERVMPLIEEIVKYCTIVIATIPILCIYPFCQRFFIKGVMLGSLKE